MFLFLFNALEDRFIQLSGELEDEGFFAIAEGGVFGFHECIGSEAALKDQAAGDGDDAEDGQGDEDLDEGEAGAHFRDWNC